MAETPPATSAGPDTRSAVLAEAAGRAITGVDERSGHGTVPGFSPGAALGPGVAAFGCDGHDRHRLGMDLRQSLSCALSGVALIGLYLWLGLSPRALGSGIGLLLLPLVGVLFERWVDGPVLYYRSWGRLHRLPLRSVTAVTAGKSGSGRGSVLLSAPGLAKPLRIRLLSRGYEMPTPPRQHLRLWLSAPKVHWTPAALSVVTGDSHRVSSARGRRLVGLVLPLVALGAGVLVSVNHGDAAFAIPGVPGYSRFAGPGGEPLPVGRPWGTPCQPIHFSVEEHVPDWVYAQISAVLAEARQDGVDVTLENRQFFWEPNSLYYVEGQSPATAVRVAIFANDGTPPRLPTGQPEHQNVGWDARPDPNGQNEDLTFAQGTLWMQTVNADPVVLRRSIRQVIAMTQGIIGTSQADSAIAPNSRIDHFTSSDIAAMQQMSGCSTARISG